MSLIMDTNFNLIMQGNDLACPSWAVNPLLASTMKIVEVKQCFHISLSSSSIELEFICVPRLSFISNWVSTVAARFLYLEYLTQTEVERYSMSLKLMDWFLTLAVPNRPSLSEVLSCFRFPYHFLRGFMGRAGCVLLPFIMYKSNKANGVA